ncbi:glutamate carboxypeptidase [Candidatus Planktophila limnetica]|uniref:Glutamate carboxypeptidase n=2 Tax=Candidatus Planktophila limnetica TaxID=573600 RepID=A0A249LH18_9ACTN|nr:glutamate carboxypeptidase [Candidatus Planktophila limnetica]
MLAALEALVKCESPTEDLNACNDVVRLASDIATRVLGTPAEIRQIEGRPVFWWGAAQPDVVLLAHLDTVWPIGSFTPLWQINGDVLRGPGTYDMKAGFVQALFALKGISGSVALIGTTDEETGSHASRKLIQDVSSKAKAVLVLEAAIDGKVKTGRKGTAMYQVHVHGRAAHAGLEPEKGINATTEIAHIITSLASLENKEKQTTVVPTLVKAGNSTNTVPDYAVLDIDARSFSTDEINRVDAAIRALKPLHPEARIEITGGLNRPPLETTSTMELYERAEKVAARIGMPPLGHASVGGASDGNFAAAAGAKVLDGLGAVGSGAHATTEWISIKALEERSAFLHEFVKDLLND